jgi:hypothetical protein
MSENKKTASGAANKSDYIHRLQAERTTCIQMAGNYQTTFAHSITLFRRADKLQRQIESEVTKDALSI